MSVRARDQFATFYRYVWRYDTPPHIRLLIECLQAFEEDQFDRFIVIEPPGHAKSTVTTIAYPSWHLGRQPDHSVIGASTSGTIADMFQDSIAEVFETDARFESCFPKVRPDKRRGWSSDGGLFLKRPYRPGQKDPSLFFTGAGGPMISRRADLMILDDTVDEPTARSDMKLATRVEWVKQTVRSRLKPGGKLVVSGTVWAEADVLNTLAEIGTFVVLTMRALSPTTQVYAEVAIPDGVSWKPRGAIEYDPDEERRALLTPGRTYVGAEA